MRQQRKSLWWLQVAEEQRQGQRLVRVLEQLLEQLGQQQQVLVQQRQALVRLKRRHNLELQLQVSSCCRASTKCRRCFSTADCRGCCASCRCWWWNQPRKQTLPRQRLQTTLLLYLVSSCSSSKLMLQRELREGESL